MKDHAEAIEIVTTEAYADVLGDPVTDRIRVAQAFALDDLDRPHARCAVLSRSNSQFHCWQLELRIVRAATAAGPKLG